MPTATSTVYTRHLTYAPETRNEMYDALEARKVICPSRGFVCLFGVGRSLTEAPFV